MTLYKNKIFKNLMKKCYWVFLFHFINHNLHFSSEDLEKMIQIPWIPSDGLKD